MTQQRQLILASGSPWRRQLLDRLGLVYTWTNPDIDEARRPDEPPSALVERLALSKARRVAQNHDNSLIIGADQVAVFGDDVLGKPGDADTACANLHRFSGQRVCFLTGLALIDTAYDRQRVVHERHDVVFRSLNTAEIERYVDRERPLDCAGSFRMEGLGITLFERLEGDDPNTLIGLPLIRLCALLREAGLDPLLAQGNS